MKNIDGFYYRDPDVGVKTQTLMDVSLTRIGVTAVIVLLATSCSSFNSEPQNKASEPVGIESPHPSGTESQQVQPCPVAKRPLNPAPTLSGSESELDTNFRQAYTSANAGDFTKAIANYTKAAELSVACECDRKHAEAGKKAAREAEAVLNKGGMAAKPTQFFWGRLQELTQTLPCIEIR